MPSRVIHNKFDRVLLAKGIISSIPWGDALHRIMDQGTIEYGGKNHRLIDPCHDPERIELFFSFPPYNNELKETLEQLSETEKRDLIQMARFHVLLDKIKSENPKQNPVLWFQLIELID